MKKFVAIPLMATAALALAACGETAAPTEDTAAASSEAAVGAGITAEEVTAAQITCGEGIVGIGAVSTEGGDVAARATEHINQFYGYEDGMEILFKPTLAADDQFRETTEEALNYFVGKEGTEDGGFAIAPYTAVRWEPNGTVIADGGDMAVAMGNYYFTRTDGTETKVEYSFAYEKDEDGELKIVLHHSSLPFSAS